MNCNTAIIPIGRRYNITEEKFLRKIFSREKNMRQEILRIPMHWVYLTCHPDVGN